MSETTNPPPNILFILTDQERYFDEYPSSVDRPALKRLQEMGTAFENHQICASVCTPSRSTIYTGQHIVNTGMFDNTNFPWQGNLSTEIPTMGNRMRDAGYHTAYKGKWHLSEEFEREFEEGTELLSMEEYGFSDFLGVGDVIGMNRGGYQFDPMVASMAIQWLRSKGEDRRAADQPWLLAVNLVNPHDVMFFDADLDDAGQQREKAMMNIERAPDHATYNMRHDVPLPKSWSQSLNEAGRPVAHANYMAIHDMMVGPIEPSDQERWERYQNYYFNCLRDVDRQLGRLLDEVEDQGLLENTIIIYTSDHGEMASAHGLRGKGAFAFKEHNNVPLIIVHPEIEGGRRCRAVTSHLDLIPTMIGNAGIPESEKAAVGEGLPGHDLSPLLMDPEAAEYDAIRPAALFAFNMLVYLDPDFVVEVMEAMRSGSEPTARPDLEGIRGAIRSIFDGRYRYTRYFAPKQHNRSETLDEILQFNDLELFDLHSDPDEMTNLALSPDQHRDLIEEQNVKMNNLIDDEIGEDVGQMLPGASETSWVVDRLDP